MALLDVRSLFDIPDEVAYLNCAYMGPLPKVAVEAGRSALARKSRPWTIGTDDFFTPVEAMRARVANLLRADSEGVAITPSVSYGLATAAANLRLQQGQVVVVTAGQFPSDLHCWKAMATRDRGSVHAVAAPADGDWTAAVLADLEMLGDRVGVVSVPPCHWSDGAVVDLVAVGEASKRAGASYVVDVTQWLGAVPFDAAEVGADVVAGATYKWLLGPYSLGFVWLAPHLRDGAPLEHNWITRSGSDDFAALVDPAEGFRPGARRFDMGEVSNFLLLPVAAAALDLLGSWTIDAVREHARTLTERIVDGAADLGFGVAPPGLRAPHLIGLRLAGTGAVPGPLAATLAGDGVHVSVRGDAVRVSAHVYNTVDDAERLLSSLRSALGE